MRHSISYNLITRILLRFTTLNCQFLKRLIYSLYIGIIFLSLLCTTTIPYSLSNFRHHALLTTAFILLASNETSLNQTLEVITKKINLNANDVRVAAGISCSLWALSRYIPHKPTKLFLQSTSILLPAFAALLSQRLLKKLQTVPLIKHSIYASEFCSHLPIMDIFFECTNKDCNSICTECKLRRSYQMLPIIAATTALCLHAKAYYIYHYKPLAQEFKTLITNKAQCSICLEEYTEQCLPVELHNDNVSHVKHYVCTQCYNDAFLKHRTSQDVLVAGEIDGIHYESYEKDQTPCSHCIPKCPLCREPLDNQRLIADRLDYALRHQKRAGVR